MAKNETTGQHFVPRAHLNPFGEEISKGEYKIHFLKKDDLSNVVDINTRKICKEHHGYTIAGATEEERQFVENAYGEIWDDNYKTVYDAVTDDSLTEIDESTRRLIISTVTSMMFRTRRLKNVIGQGVVEALQYTINVSKSIGAKSVDFLGEEMLLDGRTAKEMAKEYEARQHDSLVLSQLQFAMILARARQNDRITVYKIDAEDGFLTSDHPVYMFNPAAPQGMPLAPMTPSNILSLPINRKYRIDLTQCLTGEDSHRVVRFHYHDLLAQGELACNNEHQYQNCEKFLLGDPTTLTNFERRRNDVELRARIDVARTEFMTKVIANYGGIL